MDGGALLEVCYSALRLTYGAGFKELVSTMTTLQEAESHFGEEFNVVSPIQRARAHVHSLQLGVLLGCGVEDIETQRALQTLVQV